MPNKKTFSQLAYSDSSLPTVNDPDHWSKKQSKRFFELVWQGIDLFKQNFPHIDFSKVDEQVERDITQLLEARIQNVMTGEEPFYVQHESYEMETRQPAPAKPPGYDIAFVMRESERLKFPIEAKVLRTDGQVGEYVKDVKEAFIPCIYAPLSFEGSMLGYLLEGTSNKAFKNIGKSLNVELHQHPDFKKRQHKFSEHSRQVPKGKEEIYPSQFRCHHLIFEMTY